MTATELAAVMQGIAPVIQSKIERMATEIARTELAVVRRDVTQLQNALIAAERRIRELEELAAERAAREPA